MLISDWSSDVCSSDLRLDRQHDALLVEYRAFALQVMHGGAADDDAKEGLVRRVTEHYAATLQLRELLHEEDVPALLAYHGAVAKTRRAFVEMTGFDDLKHAYEGIAEDDLTKRALDTRLRLKLRRDVQIGRANV